MCFYFLVYVKECHTEGVDIYNLARGITVRQRKYPCDKCGKVYKWKESLFKHKRIECGKPPRLACEICGNRFMHKHHLAKHLTSIHQFPPMNGADIIVFKWTLPVYWICCLHWCNILCLLRIKTFRSDCND